MSDLVAVIDTNVVVAGLLTSAASAPTRVIVDGMLEGAFPFLVSTELMAEYRQVLLRPRVTVLHGLCDGDIDCILKQIALNAIVCQPSSCDLEAPDPGDQLLWDLLATERRAVLVTGDRALLASPPRSGGVITPEELVHRAGLHRS